ncbi:hypothetical protein OIU77_012125 [Salix suchowensis]|uniref:DUF7731 domain-containing protein n=1 Tax=Salix suchowensis TaxID=1278906 RepID=A0ABQ9A2K5_9ROSI|nr:hypothetical protein OIU77_012125 [Salix suchowensis]
MAHVSTFRLWVLSAVLVGVSIFCFNLGKADEGDYNLPQIGAGISGGVPQTGTGSIGGTGSNGGVPQTGTGSIGGTGSNGGLPQTGTGSIGGAGSIGGGPQTGTGSIGGGTQTGTGINDADPPEVVAKALLCFSNKYIYSSCEEAYRLTETGSLNVPPGYADSYCGGPCLSETHLVLSCIESIMGHFVFYNKATVRDIRNTIKAGCSYGPERGNFDVSEHLQYEENHAFMAANQILLGIGFMFAGQALLLRYL